jgi:hypothetical protein
MPDSKGFSNHFYFAEKLFLKNSVSNHCCPRKINKGVRHKAALFFIAFVITTSKKP